MRRVGEGRGRGLDADLETLLLEHAAMIGRTAPARGRSSRPRRSMLRALSNVLLRLVRSSSRTGRWRGGGNHRRPLQAALDRHMPPLSAEIWNASITSST